MKILAPFEAVQLSQTKPGDLLRVGGVEGWIALVIHEEDGIRVLGVLQDGKGTEPYHVVLKRDVSCLRYVSGWVMDLPREAAVSGSDWQSAAGAIHIGKSGLVMNFDSPSLRENELTVNLKSFEWDDVSSESVAFPHWRIWASEEEQRLKGAKPILEFSAAQ